MSQLIFCERFRTSYCISPIIFKKPTILPEQSVTDSFTAVYTKTKDSRISDSVTGFKNILQVSHKDNRITFLEHSFFVNFEHVFVSWGTLIMNNSEKLREITLFTRSGIFKVYDEVPS